MSVALLLLGLVLFVMLVVVHEFGHFIAARKSDVEVEEFGIGFPPQAWAKMLKNNTLFTLNWLPLGGFVKLKGEHDADNRKGSYGAASLLNKIKIMLAGVGMNLLAAFVILTFLALVGMPKIVENQFTVTNDTVGAQNDVLVGYVEQGSPADKGGFLMQDQITSLAGEDGEAYSIKEAEDLPEATKKLAGQKVTANIVRMGEAKTLTTTLRSEDEVVASRRTSNPKGYLGLSPTELTLRRSTWSAPIVAAGVMKQFTELTFKGLGSAIGGLVRGNTEQASSQVAGPVGVFVLLKDGSGLGYQFVLMIIAIISLTLAIMNVLPIPALDGGRLFVTLFYRLRNKKLTEKMEDRIHGTGFAVIIVLGILITIVDIRRFF